MTSKQLKLLETIEEYWEEFGCGPSLDALADALGLSSKSTIHAMIHRLKDGGWVTMQPNRWRTVMSTRIRALELLGKVSEVALFTERLETTSSSKSSDEIRLELEQKIQSIFNKA